MTVNPIAWLSSWVGGARAAREPIEPPWHEALGSVDERCAAAQYWRIVTAQMR
jgi:hypothetical protein